MLLIRIGNYRNHSSDFPMIGNTPPVVPRCVVADASITVEPVVKRLYCVSSKSSHKEHPRRGRTHIA